MTEYTNARGRGHTGSEDQNKADRPTERSVELAFSQFADSVKYTILMMNIV